MKTIQLNGRTLTSEDVYSIAMGDVQVEISPEAWDRVVASRQVLDCCAEKGHAIYGYNRGVGWNKDKVVFEEYFHQYNRDMIRAHSVSVGPLSSPQEVRAMLAVRLNTALCGGSGLSPHVVEYYKEFINCDILPDVPRKGSVGMSDITSLAHIGLAFMGEGMVTYKGRHMSAREALDEANINPVRFAPKDGLGVVVSNAHSAAMASLLIHETKELLTLSNKILCLGLEGICGLVSVFDESANRLRGFEGQIYSAGQCREFLKGSYLNQITEEQQLYDSLSYSDGATVSGSVYDALGYLEHFLTKQLNSTDDNPCVIPEEQRVVLACPNFEPTSWVIGVELLSIALSHLSKVCCQRTITLTNPDFTRLARELSPDESRVCGYSITPYPATALDAEIRSLANPSSMDVLPVSGAMEDHATNAVLVVEKAEKILDNLRYILAIECIQAAQAVDLRKPSSMGCATGRLYEKIRESIAFLSEDRCHSDDINKVYQLIKDGSLR